MEIRLYFVQSSPLNIRLTPDLPHPRPFTGAGPVSLVGVVISMEDLPLCTCCFDSSMVATELLESTVFITFRASTTTVPDVVNERQLSRFSAPSNNRLSRTFLLSQRLAAPSLIFASIDLRTVSVAGKKITAA